MQLEKSFIADIKNILAAARQKAYTAINHAMVQAYWHVGKRIVEEDQQGKEKATYGDALLKELSKSLTQELGQGFSYANLKNFRKFYITFPDFEKGYALRSLLGWTHYRLIMRVENPIAREYYLNECAGQSWSARVLERNINSFYYERLLSSQQNNEALAYNKPTEKKTLADFI